MSGTYLITFLCGFIGVILLLAKGRCGPLELIGCLLIAPVFLTNIVVLWNSLPYLKEEMIRNSLLSSASILSILVLGCFAFEIATFWSAADSLNSKVELPVMVRRKTENSEGIGARIATYLQSALRDVSTSRGWSLRVTSAEQNAQPTKVPIPQNSKEEKRNYLLSITFFLLAATALLPTLIESGFGLKTGLVEIKLKRQKVSESLKRIEKLLEKESKSLEIEKKKDASEWELLIHSLVAYDRVIGLSRVLGSLYYATQSLLWKGVSIQREREFFDVKEMLHELRMKQELSSELEVAILELSELLERVIEGEYLDESLTQKLTELSLWSITLCNAAYDKEFKNWKRYSVPIEFENTNEIDCDETTIVNMIDKRVTMSAANGFRNEKNFAKIYHIDRRNFQATSQTSPAPVEKNGFAELIAGPWLLFAKIWQWPAPATAAIVTIVLIVLVNTGQFSTPHKTGTFVLNVITTFICLVLVSPLLGNPNLMRDGIRFVRREWKLVLRTSYFCLLYTLTYLLMLGDVAHSSGLGRCLTNPCSQAIAPKVRKTVAFVSANAFQIPDRVSMNFVRVPSIPIAYTDIAILSLLFCVPYLKNFSSLKLKDIEILLPQDAKATTALSDMPAETWSDSLNVFAGYSNRLALSRVFGTVYACLYRLQAARTKTKFNDKLLPEELIDTVFQGARGVPPQSKELCQSFFQDSVLAIHHPEFYRTRMTALRKQGEILVETLSQLHRDTAFIKPLKVRYKLESEGESFHCDLYEAELKDSSGAIQIKVLDVKGLIDVLDGRLPSEFQLVKATLLRPINHLIVVDQNGKRLYGEPETGLKDWSKQEAYLRRRLVFYIPGILQSEGLSLRRVSYFFPLLMKQNAYPIMVFWPASYWTALSRRIQQAKESAVAESKLAIEGKNFGGVTYDTMFEWRQDEEKVLELSLRKSRVRERWEEIRRKAYDIVNATGGALSKASIEELLRGITDDYEIHLIAHSSGSVLACQFAEVLCKVRKVDSISFLGPSCTIQLFKETVLPCLKDKGIEEVSVFTIGREYEELDSCSANYAKSILALHSNVLDLPFQAEQAASTPILGLEDNLLTDPDLRDWLGEKISIIRCPNLNAMGIPMKSDARRHIDFDRDLLTLETLFKKFGVKDLSSSLLNKKP